jgi:Zn-dependent peptidase ImmA (M78 family)
MLRNANSLLRKYKIEEFPIKMDMLEYIISDAGIKIEIARHLRESLYYEVNTSKIIYLGPALEMAKKRECLIHELAHTYHCGNTAHLAPLAVSKNEEQAKAFAAYFLMPVGVFEAACKDGENRYSLSNIFGVKQDFVMYRQQLGLALLHSGLYNKFRYKHK